MPKVPKAAAGGLQPGRPAGRACALARACRPPAGDRARRTSSPSASGALVVVELLQRPERDLARLPDVLEGLPGLTANLGPEELGAGERCHAADRSEPDRAAGDGADDERGRGALGRARSAQVEWSLVEVDERRIDRGQSRDLEVPDRLALGERGAARGAMRRTRHAAGAAHHGQVGASDFGHASIV